MNIPGKYTLPTEIYTKMVTLTKWYQGYPKEFEQAIGNSFHENMNDLQNNLFMENVVEPLGEPEETGYYVNGYRVDGSDNLHVLLMDNDNTWENPEDVVVFRKLAD